jgi:hypothetical protein
VVPRNDEQRSSEAAEEGRRRLVLARPAEVRQVAGGDDELRLDLLDERFDRHSRGAIVVASARADVEVRHVEDACAHRRRRLQ